MLILIIIILIEFLVIYFLSRQIFTLLFTLFFLPTKHKTISNYIVSFLFLPGTIIHEFSHALVARLLGVGVHDIMLYPHKDKETGEFKAGACEIEKADPFRLSLIGIAPSLIGIGLIVLSVFYLYNFTLPIYARADLSQLQTTMQGLIPSINSPYKLVLLLVISVISMTMFTSRRDLQEFLMLVPAVGLIALLLYYAGFRVSLSEGLISFLQKPLTALAFVLGITFFIDLLIYVFLFVPVSLLLSLFNKQLK